MTHSFRPTVLLIDDEIDLLVAWTLLLEHEGFRVVTATRATSGLELARQETPAVVVTDLMMPGTDGAEFCRLMKKDPTLRHIPVILWTASSDIPPRIRCDCVLRKPVAREAMVRHIRVLLGGPQAALSSHSP